MKKISTKLIVLLVAAALLPLTLFGLLSIWTARTAAFQEVNEGHLAVAKRAAAQIQSYVADRMAILQALAQHLGETDLQPWQKERVIKNYVIQFDEYRRIALTDLEGREVATSRLGVPLGNRSGEPAFQAAVSGSLYRSAVFLSDNLTPSMTIAVPVTALGQVTGVLIGEVNLIAMWDLVDSIRIGREGYAFVVSRSGQLLAHGRGSQKPKVLQQADLSSLAIVRAVRQGLSQTVVYAGVTDGEKPVEMIGVSAPIPDLGWGLVIEQPAREAYAQARTITLELAGLIGLFLLLVIGVGYAGGRRYVVEPIQQLMQATRRVAAGNLSETVNILTQDEFQTLGESFNEMTTRLGGLQERIRRDERTVVFGRIAAGLAHDLRHPILNIENNSRLLLRRFDEEAWNRFVKIVERELAEVKRFLDDLRDLGRPTPLTMVALDLRRELAELADAFAEEARRQGVTIRCHVEGDAAAPVSIRADKFALGRVFKNLIRNALDAMARGGTLEIRVTPAAQGAVEGQDLVLVAVSDTGHGIPPERLSSLFADYFTTKRKGLGLGLAVTKKIVEELGGTISVSSIVGRGSVFTLSFNAATQAAGSSSRSLTIPSPQ